MSICQTVTVVRVLVLSRQCATMSKLHVKCRYPNEYKYRVSADVGSISTVNRQQVPDDLVPWEKCFPTYNPMSFTAPFVFKAPWADPKLDDEKFYPKWNQLDGKVDRQSHEGIYKVHNGIALNIRGRTGLQGRGVLGRFGPNHAADPVVTRWKRDDAGQIVHHPDSGKPILQFVAIQRRDTGEWAIPGGMVDPGENVSQTVKREFMEEALNSLEKGQKETERLEKLVQEFFDSNGEVIYNGYVDDPRNTDNAWMETVAFLFHDDLGTVIGQFPLQSGDDAKDLRWIDIGSDVRLYASHEEFVAKAAEMKGAHW